MQTEMMRNNQGKVEYALIPFSFWDLALSRLDLDGLNPKMVEDITKVLMFGAAKYAPFNWAKGGSWLSVINSAIRHLLASQREENDPESGLPHLAHFGCNLLFLIDFTANHIGTDDRRGLCNPTWVNPERSGFDKEMLFLRFTAWAEGADNVYLDACLETLNEIYPNDPH